MKSNREIITHEQTSLSPWRVSDNGGQMCILDGNGSVIAVVKESDEMVGNAQMMAASEGLYKACCDVYGYMSDRQQPEARAKLRNAIIKAGGVE